MSNVIAEFTINQQEQIDTEFTLNIANNDHNLLNNRDMADQHPISAITGLEEALAQHTDAQWGSITGNIENQTDLQYALDAKQDVISDLSTIRSGAELGATAVQSVTEGTTNGTIKVDGSYVNQFNSMFNNTTGSTATGGCTVHFPSNLSSTIAGLTGYPTFGGSSSYINLAFDLPATGV